jgi:hypothetical protein
MRNAIIVLITLLALNLQAATNIVIYNADNGMIYQTGNKPDLGGWKLSTDQLSFKCGPEVWANKKILITTESAAYGGNISQLTDKTDVDPLDLLNDYTQWSDRERKMLALLVKEINILRVKAGLAARTKAQVISALKDE